LNNYRNKGGSTKLIW